MKHPKAIVDLIDKPRIGKVDIINEVSSQSIELSGVLKEKLELESGKYTSVDFTDTICNDLVANNISCFRSAIIRCQFKNSQCTGLSLPRGHFKHVIFENCRINLTNFRSSTFERCIFRGCDFSEADFAMSKFTNVLFESCQLIDAEFSNCNSKQLEFSDTNLSSIKGIPGLKGAQISSQNLVEISPLLAHELNISVRG